MAAPPPTAAASGSASDDPAGGASPPAFSERAPKALESLDDFGGAWGTYKPGRFTSRENEELSLE